MNKPSNLVNNVNQKFITKEKKMNLEVDTVIHFSAEQVNALNTLLNIPELFIENPMTLNVRATINKETGLKDWYMLVLPISRYKYAYSKYRFYRLPEYITVTPGTINIKDINGRVLKEIPYMSVLSGEGDVFELCHYLFNFIDELNKDTGSKATSETTKNSTEEKTMFTETKEAKLGLDASKINLINEALGGCIDVNVADKPIVFNYTMDDEGECIGYNFSMPTVHKDEITGEVITVDVSVDTLGYTFKASDGSFNGEVTTYGKVAGKEIHTAANYLISFLEAFKTVEEFNNISLESEVVKYLSEEEIYLLKRLGELETKVKKKALPVFYELLEELVYCMLNLKKELVNKNE